MRDKAHDDAMAELYNKNSDYAVDLLNSILLEGDEKELVVVLRQMIKTVGGGLVATETREQISRESHHVLPNESLSLSVFLAILKKIGLRLTVQAQSKREKLAN